MKAPQRFAVEVFLCWNVEQGDTRMDEWCGTLAEFVFVRLAMDPWLNCRAGRVRSDGDLIGIAQLCPCNSSKIPQDLRCTFEVFTSMGGHAVNCRTHFIVSLSDRVIGWFGCAGFHLLSQTWPSLLGLGCRQFGQIIRSSHFSHSKAPWLESHENLEGEGCQYV